MSRIENFSKDRLEGHIQSLNILIAQAKENIATYEAEIAEATNLIKGTAAAVVEAVQTKVEETVEVVKEEVKKAAPKKAAKKVEKKDNAEETPAEDPKTDK